MPLSSSNFDVKSINFSQFWPRAFSQNCWKKPCASSECSCQTGNLCRQTEPWLLLFVISPRKKMCGSGYPTYPTPCRVAQSVTCLATDGSLPADPGVTSSIPALSHTFRGDWSWNNFYGHSPPFRWIIQEGLLSVTSESMCMKYLLIACSSLPRKKCG